MSSETNLSVFNGDVVKYPTLLREDDINGNQEKFTQQIADLKEFDIPEKVSYSLFIR